MTWFCACRPNGQMAGLELKAGKKAYQSKAQTEDVAPCSRLAACRASPTTSRRPTEFLCGWKAIDRTRIKSM